MTYVASPSHGIDDAARAKDLEQCLDSARRRLDEVSKSSTAEKENELISSAVDAGWDEQEVRRALGNKSESDHSEFAKPTIGLVPSSSL